MKGLSKALRYTKMIVAFFVGVVLLASCEKNDSQPSIQIGFEKEVYSVPFTGKTTVTIVANRAVAQNTTIPLTFSGTAVKGTDYTVSAEATTIVAGTDRASITITTVANFDRTKNIQISLGVMPGGMEKGPTSTTTVGIPDASLLIYSFEGQKSLMTQTAEVTLELKTLTGAFVAEKELKIPIEIGAGSTAIEGTHYNFDGAKEVVIPVGKSRGVVKLNYLKQEKGKDIIELKLGSTSSHYVAGNYEKTQVTIFGPLYTQLSGSWKHVAMVNEEWWKTSMGESDDMTKLPTANSNQDTIRFTDEGLEVSMNGVLKNYFRTSPLSFKGEVNERLQEFSGWPVPVVKMLLVNAHANVAFSATTKLERQAEIGFRVFTSGGKDILEVTIRDYEPVDFLQSTYNTYKGFGDVPVMTSLPLRYHFEKVNP